MNGNKRISVIVPVFNDLAGLRRCLDGISSQKYPHAEVEVIIVDNGSEPPLEDSMLHGGSFRLVSCATPGSYAARNRGVSSASGDLLAFVDADCVPDPDWLSAGTAALHRGAGRHVVGGDVFFAEPAARTGTALYQAAVGFQQEKNIRETGFSATANLFCTREQMDAIGPFDEDLLSGGDRDWCWRAAKAGFSVEFEPRAVVRTAPRARLGDAVRQARRVTAGRSHLRRQGTVPGYFIQRHGTIGKSLAWIIARPEFTAWEKVRIIAAGASIRGAAEIERIRLRLGGKSERR